MALDRVKQQQGGGAHSAPHGGGIPTTPSQALAALKREIGEIPEGDEGTLDMRGQIEAVALMDAPKPEARAEGLRLRPHGLFHSALAGPMNGEVRDAALMSLFQDVDVDESGTVTLSELTAYLKITGKRAAKGAAERAKLGDLARQHTDHGRPSMRDLLCNLLSTCTNIQAMFKQYVSVV